jgi:hypothetical protein
MTSKISFLRLAGLLLALGLVSAVLSSVASAQSYKAESAAVPVPSEIAAPIAARLSPSAIRVTGPSGTLCEIWLRNPLPPAATPDTSLGILFGQIAEGSLVGAVRFDSKGADYREQTIQPGVYTMRYMLQPVDGNHQGVSPYRDFLLLSPAALDTSLDNVPGPDLIKLSKKASGTGHASVWSLLPADGAPPTLPGIAHQDDGDLWVVFFQAPLPKPVTMGLVVVGHAPET